MGTLIEDAAEVATLATAIDTAITAKGGTLVGGGKLRNAAAGIATISGGGEEEWTPPSEWPNLRTLLANDTETAYTNKTYILIQCLSGDTTTLNVPKWITSDGATYYGNATHTWGSGVKYNRWVALYTNDDCPYYRESNREYPKWLWVVSNGKIGLSEGAYYLLQSIEGQEVYLGQNNSGGRILCEGYNIQNIKNFKSLPYNSVWQMFWQCRRLVSFKHELDLSACTNCSGLFQDCGSLTAVPDELDLSACTNCSSMFYNCGSLTAVPDELDLSACTNCSSMFYNCGSLKAVPDELDLSACTNCSSMFSGCTTLTAVPDELDLSACTNCSSMFSGCTTLTAVPDELDLSACTNCSNMFSNCGSLTAVPDELDLSACTNFFNVFYYCRMLENLPNRMDLGKSTNNQRAFEVAANIRNLPLLMTANYSVSFSSITKVPKNNVATFDSNGVVNGGFVYGLDSFANGAYQSSCPNSGQTITFSSTTRNLFTSTEWTAVVTALTAKNWGVSPAA